VQTVKQQVCSAAHRIGNAGTRESMFMSVSEGWQPEAVLCSFSSETRMAEKKVYFRIISKDTASSFQLLSILCNEHAMKGRICFGLVAL
jgi:hypothetical protein